MFKTFLRLFGFVAIANLIACSSGTIVKTYEGETLLKEQIAILNAPEYITLVSVNGRDVPRYLLSSIDVNYGLKPGLNVVVFEYESVWAVARSGADEPRSERVSSGKKEVVIDASVGEKYTFKFDQAENIRDAKAMAGNFSASIVNQKDEVVASSAALGSYQPVVQASNSSNQAQSAATVDGASVATPLASTAPVTATGASSSLPPVEGMKVLWNSATAEEKKAFLKWAFQ